MKNFQNQLNSDKSTKNKLYQQKERNIRNPLYILKIKFLHKYYNFINPLKLRHNNNQITAL